MNHTKESKCRYCGRKIYYDPEDGYWDSLRVEDRVVYWEPLCEEEHADYLCHEPLTETQVVQSILNLYEM